MSLTPEHAKSTLTVILDWYKTLPKPVRERLSLANLHDLSKALRPSTGDGDVAGLVEALERIAEFRPKQPSGNPGSYQRAYDNGFNNAGTYAKDIAEAALQAKEAGRG